MFINIKDEKTAIIEGDPVDVRLISHELTGKRKWVSGSLHVQLSRKNIETIDSHDNVSWSNTSALDDVKKLREQERRTISIKESSPELDYFPFKTTPFKHQEMAFILCKESDYFGLFMEMGTGKTKVGIDVSANWFANGEIDTLLITAPNGVHSQWINEQIPEHMPDFVSHVDLIYTSNQTKKWKKSCEQFMSNPRSKLLIISMHIDAFSTKKGKDFAEKILSSRNVAWIMDESVRIKNQGSNRTKNVLSLSHLAKKRIIMSGAPVTQGVEDLYTQLKFLSPHILDLSTFYKFRDEFCVTRPVPGARFGAVKIIGYRNLDLLQSLIEKHTFRVTKDECLDLPSKIYTTYHVEMTDQQARAYKEMKNDLITKLDDGSIVSASIAMSSLVKLQQIVCGHVITEEGETVLLKNNRVKSCIDILKESTGKVIIWARFRSDIFQLIDAMKNADIKYVEYSGRISNDDRQKNINIFRSDEECKVFIANPQSAGTGLNLTAASTAIYYSNDFNADTRWQSEDRIHRIGQSENALYIDMVSPNTIDVKILNSLKNKKNIADTILDVKDLLSSVS